MNLDPTTDFGKRVLQRLQTEQIIWLTTIGNDGVPQPRPVWFWWDGETFLIFSQPTAAKVKHISKDARVALNFESGHDGEDVVVFHGMAQVDPTPLSAEVHQAYLTKYAEGIEYIKMTPESLSTMFSTAIRVKPEKVRGS